MTTDKVRGSCACLPSYFDGLFGRAKNPLPQDDPFYGYHSTAQELEKYKPGDVIRSRKILIVDFPGFDAASLDAWELAFRTVARDGQTPLVTVTTVMIPPNSKRDRLLLYLPKTDAAYPGCRTSYSLRRGGNTAFGALSEQVFMEPALDRGWIVSCVDYESQNDAFGCGPQAAYATLDSIRAVTSFAEFKLAPDARIAGWGYSGGALAGGWAAQLQKSYLGEEFKGQIVGWCVGGMPVDLGTIAERVNDSVAAGLTIGVLAGLSNAYPELQKWLLENLNEAGLAIFKIAKENCFPSFMSRSLFKDLLGVKPVAEGEKGEGIFKIKEPLKQQTIQHILDENRLGNADVPIAPLFVYQAINDEVVPPGDVEALVNSWAKKGATIQLLKNDDSLIFHVTMAFATSHVAISWLDDRFEARPNAASPKRPKIETITEAFLNEAEAARILGPGRKEELKSLYNRSYSKPEQCWWYKC